MSITVQSSSLFQSPGRRESAPADNTLNLNDDVLARMSQAVNTAENLEQLLAAGSPTKTDAKNFAQFRQNSQVSQSEGVTPATGLPARNFNNVSAIASPRIITVTLQDPLEHLDSSDEDECTFHPKINSNASRLAKRGDTLDQINENLYRDAADRKAKAAEYQKMEGMLATQQINLTKSNTKSMKIVLQRLHKSLSSLIKDAETSENPGELNFEGLGVVLHRLGIFQNLQFSANNVDGEKSSLSINHQRIKPERLAKEIAFHENLWNICALASINTNFIYSDLVLKFIMTLVEEKSPVNESATLLLEILDHKLESIGLKNEKEKFTYHGFKERQGLWSMEKVVIEFRKLFEDRTSFMNTYAAGSVLKGKSAVDDDKQNDLSFKPEVNKKSAKLDKTHFTETFLKKINATAEDIEKHNLQDRRHRLNKLHKHIQDNKTAKQAAKVEGEVAQCTFSPKIKTYKNNPNTSSSFSPTNKSGYFSQALTSSPNRHILLFEVAKTYKEKQQQKSYRTKKAEEIDEATECTFKPKLNDSYNNSPLKVEKDFYDGVPNGFKKTVERMHKGADLNETRKSDLETIPRGENYEKNRAAEFNPPKFITRPKVKSEEVLVYVDVSIGAGKTGRIGIHKGDNAKTLALNFARTYSLNATMKESLEKLLQSYITSYFAASKDNADQHEEKEDDDEEDDEEEEVAAFDVTEPNENVVKTEEQDEEVEAETN